MLQKIIPKCWCVREIYVMERSELCRAVGVGVVWPSMCMLKCMMQNSGSDVVVEDLYISDM